MLGVLSWTLLEVFHSCFLNKVMESEWRGDNSRLTMVGASGLIGLVSCHIIHNALRRSRLVRDCS